MPNDELLPEDAKGLKPCPLCDKPMEVTKAKNPYGRCTTEDCWFSVSGIAIPIDDVEQVRRFNTRQHDGNSPDTIWVIAEPWHMWAETKEGARYLSEVKCCDAPYAKYTRAKPHGDERAIYKVLEELRIAPRHQMREAAQKIAALSDHKDDGVDAEEKPADWCDCYGCTTQRKPCIKELNAAGFTITRPTSPPMASGWVMVPKEPNDCMNITGKGVFQRHACRIESCKNAEEAAPYVNCAAYDIYKAMIAARPPCPTASEATGKVDLGKIKRAWIEGNLDPDDKYEEEYKHPFYQGGCAMADHLHSQGYIAQPPAQSWEWLEGMLQKTIDQAAKVYKNLDAWRYHDVKKFPSAEGQLFADFANSLNALRSDLRNISDAVKAEAEKRG